MGLLVYCCMLSHVHFILRSANEQSSELLRDVTAYFQKVIEAIENSSQESRKEWLLWMFKKVRKKNPTISNYQFWQYHNKPIELCSEKVIKRKIDYMHNNPVLSSFVTNTIDWKYSNTRNYQGDKKVLEINRI
ncbi:transposase [Zunongwangia sp.]|uniref:transposase n=1 Tax=Zunongwangia sp. TaxID=1965325 RepID=UPI003AA91DB9